MSDLLEPIALWHPPTGERVRGVLVGELPAGDDADETLAQLAGHYVRSNRWTPIDVKVRLMVRRRSSWFVDLLRVDEWEPVVGKVDA